MRKRWQLFWWQWRFRRYRVEYLRYLAALLTNFSAQLTFKVIFKKEQQRYGRHHVRGRLAALWLQRLNQHGGDLAIAWRGSFSPELLQVIRVCQHYGSRSLMQALQFLAHQQEVLQRLRRQNQAVLWPAFLAIAVLCGALVLIPLFTVPELRRAFSYVPPEYYGPATRALFATADWLLRFGWLIPLLALGVLIAVFISFSRYVGAGRLYMDRLEPWKSYRLMGAYNLLQTLGILLSLEHVHLPLESAIHRLADTSIPWLRLRLVQIQKRIIQGHTGASSFATGLLDKEDLWFLADMSEGQSLEHACMAIAQRLAERIEDRLNRIVVVARWVVLLVGVTILLALLFWHYRVFEELRHGLINMFV
ncbi:MAG TPA: type II secretion system F family protein [Paenalcaligenes sp.]|nr:type II secretion system F family protein [Paenalcaligenes sp.]